jgi:hypothetical protein
VVETRARGAYSQGSLGAARAASHSGVLGDSSLWGVRVRHITQRCTCAQQPVGEPSGASA